MTAEEPMRALHDEDYCHCRLRDGQSYRGYWVQHNGDGRWQATPPQRVEYSDGTCEEVAGSGDISRGILAGTSRTLRHKIDEAEYLFGLEEARA